MKHTKKGKLLTDVILETFKLNGLLVAAGDQLIKELGITSARWKILGALSNENSVLTVPEIAREMGQSRQAVQRLANEMMEDGLLASEENPNHQRAKWLKLTAEGRNVYRKVMEKQAPWVNEIAQEMTEAELKAMVGSLHRLNNHLSE